MQLMRFMNPKANSNSHYYTLKDVNYLNIFNSNNEEKVQLIMSDLLTSDNDQRILIERVTIAGLIEMNLKFK